MLTIDRSLLTFVDVQGKLAQLMHEKEALFKSLEILAQAASLIGLPVLWLEQNPAGLGPTIPQLADRLSGQKPISKMSFSACGCEDYVGALRASGRTQVLLAGIEAHVCIYLTAAELLGLGYEVEVIADAVSSRSPQNKALALGKIAALGAGVSCTETVIFELLRTAEHDQFKAVVKLLR